MNDQRVVYLDNASTTQLDPAALKAMTASWERGPGNASSIHAAGVQAALELEGSRAKIASQLGANEPDEIIFTSGGTESNALAILGYARANCDRGRHLVLSAIEHPSVLEAGKQLEKEGFEVSLCPVTRLGKVEASTLASLLKPGTILVSIMHANNEVGTVQDLASLVTLAKKTGAAFHTDAVQSFAKVPLNVSSLGLDLVTISAHKIHGPRGIGALYARKGTRLEPLYFGGGHERGLRPGTSNVEGAVGFAAAAAALTEADCARMRGLRDHLAARMRDRGFSINGDPEARLCNNVHVSFPGNGKKALFALSKNKIFVSTGSACNSNKNAPSHVLVAMGLSAQEVHGSLRVTLSKWTTLEQVEQFEHVLARFVSEGGA